MISTGCDANGESKRCRDSRKSPINTGAWLKSLACVMAIVLGYLTIAYFSLGRSGIEKILTGFAMPLGVGWLLLTISLFFGWFNGSARLNCWITGVCWVLMTVCCTAPVPDYLMKNLESHVTNEFRPNVDEPLDLLIVFGGGTVMGKNRAEAAVAGDRVLYGAQLYLQGKTKRLIATGDGHSEQTRQIWQQLNIPDTDVVLLPGANTFQEIENLKPFLRQSTQQRIGILSSAYHLPRIERLATKAGVTGLIPVAANHRSRESKYTVIDFVPSPQHLLKFSDCFKEWLGGVVGR
jgi:uncharacterized SAM-binding protein YcdF (DUF218 family)